MTLGLLTGTVFASQPVHAQAITRTVTWTGNGGNNRNWGNSGNWDANPYPDGSTTAVNFITGVANALALLDFDYSVYGLTFGYNSSNTATSFTISGNGSDNTLSVYEGGITNNTALTQTIDASVALRASQSFTSVSGGTLQFTSGQYNQINLLGNRLTVGGAGNTTIASRILDSTGSGGTLTKTGTGTLTLSNIGNSFTGNIAINQGTLVAGAAQTTYNPATSVLGSTMTAGRTITVGDGTNAATLNFAASNVFGTGNSNPQASITINKGATLTNSGGQFNILPNITLNGGTLSGNGGLSVTQQAFAFAYGSVTVGGSQYSTIYSSGTNSGYHLGGSTTFNVAATGDPNEVDLAVFGNLIDNFDSNGAGSLVKTGAGTMVLAGFNTYTGSTTVNGGTLRVGLIGYDSRLGNGTGNVIVNSGGQLVFGGGSPAGSASITNNGGAITFNNFSTADRATITNNGGAITFNSDNRVDVSRGGSATITNNSGGTITFNGYARAGNVTITNNAGGSLFFAGSNVQAESATIINNSTADFYSTSAAGSATITNNSFLTFHDTSTASGATIKNNGVLFVNQRTSGLSVGDLSGTGSVLLGSNTLTVGSLNKSGSVSGTISGTGGLVKAGTGTLTLSGDNTYGGGTTINAGTLAARGSALGSGAATVNAGGTLAVGQAANVARTSLASGAQSLSLTSLVVNSAANNTTPFLTFNLFGGGANDTLLLTGTGTALSFSSAGGSGSQFIVGFASGTGALLSGGTYTLITFSNPSATVTSGFDVSNANNSFAARGTGNLGGTTGTFAWTKNSGGSITGLQYSLISSSDTPEPTSLLLLGLGFAASTLSTLIAAKGQKRSASHG